MGRLNSACDAIFKALSEHPWLSRRQLEAYLHFSSAGIRYGLRQLRTRRLIWQANSHQPGMRARSLYAPTREGIQELARKVHVPLRDYVAQTRLSPDRLNRLVLTMERVFQLRTFFLWVSHGKSKRTANPNRLRKQTSAPAEKGNAVNRSQSNPGLWNAVTWDVDVGKLFSAKGKAVWIPFHGAALMERGPKRSSEAPKSKDERTLSERSEAKVGRWAFVVVEFDMERAPVAGERERLAQFVAAQDDPRYWGKGKEALFPVLIVVAQNELRLQEYYSLLRSAALARHLPMPRAYLSTVRSILTLRDDPSSPIWYSTISGRRTSLLFDTEGSPGPLPEQVPWRKLPLTDATSKRGDSKRDIGDTLVPQARADVAPATLAAKSNVHGNTESLEELQDLSEIAQISLKLTPIAKLLLDEIAAHPLLTRDELVLLLKVTLRWAKPALAEMTKLQLIEVHQSRFLIAPKGAVYLAHAAGFGIAVRRYVRARGWGNGFDALLRHWKHTQEENAFFLSLARVAHQRHHRLTWLSELEGRLYYEAGQRWHSFLPDGRGAYVAGRTRYEFALEIDRSRAPQARLRGKFAEYDACISSNVLRSEGIEFLRVLVVTGSWERAEAWRRSALDVKARFPVFITTQDRLTASGVDSPIWLRGDLASTESAAASPKVCCFECYTDKDQ